MNIKAIETQYQGYRFRSRLEARWAVFFDALGVKWEYEKEGFDLGDYGWYLPDFWLPKYELWIEIEGLEPTDEEALRLICLAEATNQHAMIFTGIPESSKDISWWQDIALLTEGQPWSWSRKIGNKFPIFFVSAEEWGPKETCRAEEKMCCPYCEMDYVHFANPTLTESDDYSAWEGRGDALRIPMWCENGHSWTIRFGFHKGQTLVVAENLWEEESNPGLVFANGSEEALRDACRAARSARFEHGETPRIPSVTP